MNAAKTYATQLAEDQVKITMAEFFDIIHAQFYPNQNVSFMKYFLELTERNGEFVVHHSKLLEYGIMTSEQSSDAKKKFDTLGLIEGIDYQLRELSEQSEGSRGVKYSNHYYLTPKGFKKCLMRAQRRAGQPVDPVIYIDYYLLLEDVFHLYTMYERIYAEKKMNALRETISGQYSEIGDLLDTITDMNIIDPGSPREMYRDDGSDNDEW